MQFADLLIVSAIGSTSDKEIHADKSVYRVFLTSVVLFLAETMTIAVYFSGIPLLLRSDLAANKLYIFNLVM